MLKGAMHLRPFGLRRSLYFALTLIGAMPALAVSQTITAASFSDPTTRYAHGVLGDAIEHGTLVLKIDDGRTVSIVLPTSDVFEDTAPRLLDVDGDGGPEVVVVQSNARLGAKLAIYDEAGLVADTPNIGRSNRWLAPLGAMDIDGDGLIELAYIDRPHLAKQLRIWRFVEGQLEHVSDLDGFTNHRIGERDIAGGLRDCEGGPEMPEMIVASADWSRLMAITFGPKGFKTKTLGRDTSRAAFADAMACNR
jgi:hypothetical protein